MGDEAIVVALISAGVALLGLWVSAQQNRRMAALEHKKVNVDESAKVNERLNTLIEGQAAEIERLTEELKEARAAQERSTEQVLGVMADAMNKNTMSNHALADVIRESVTASTESRRAMQEVTATMVGKLAEIAASQEVIHADVRSHVQAERVASATIQERLDQGFERLAGLAVEHDERARARVLSILEAIEALPERRLPAP